MKKLLIAVLAIAGLASCTNSDVEFETAQKQIGLSPITENRTRAMVEGDAFPEEEFMVWAWYKQVDAGTSIADWQKATTAEQQRFIVN
jgi:opacity protein-like surface antigen